MSLVTWETMMASSEERKLASLRVQLARGLAALKVMLDERTVRIERSERESKEQNMAISDLRTDIAVLKTRLNALEKDVEKVEDETTGKFDLEKAKVEEKVEKTRASAAVIVALIAGIFGTLAAVIEFFVHIFGSH